MITVDYGFLKKHKREKMIIVITIFICAFISTSMYYCSMEINMDNQKYMNMYIKEGDTIWEIAKKFTPENKDIRQTVYQIGKINDLKSCDIYPGQIIKVPIE